ncbi:MAG: sodium:solute symporter, partial [Phycisphaerales bacterium]|nr:sodium:solute symporter [Phycisphaerales bacterium]
MRTNEVRQFRTRDAPTGLRALDFLVIGVYFVALIIIGWRMSRHEASTEQYFLGGRRIPWWAAGLSIFATQLSAITFMAIPAISYRTDWVYLVGATMIAGVAPIVVRIYLPFFRRLDITTAYEYLEARFSASVRVVGSVLFMLVQLGRMGIVLYLPALALSTVTGVDMYASIVVMGVLATIYTVHGGIEAVIWTDVLQVVVLLGGAVLSFVLMIDSLGGGFGEFTRDAAAAGKFHAFENTWSAAELAVWVVILGRFFENLVPYTSDQTVVQRYLATPTEAGAARSIWTNAILSVVASVLFYAVGTALWVFYRAHPERLNPSGRTDDIFPWFIATELPAGISGLVIAGIFAASMSSLDSSMNSVATAFTTDIYRKIRPDAEDRGLLRIARIATVLLGGLGTAAAAYMAWRGDTSAYDTYTKVIGLFGGGLAGLFVAGVFTRRANPPGMLIGLLASALVLYLVSTTTRLHFFLYAGIGILSCVAFGWLASRAFPSARPPSAGTTLR